MRAYKFCTVIVISIVLCGCSNEQPAPVAIAVQPKAEVATPLAAGRQLFTDKCVACHGVDGTAGIAGAANLKTLVADSATIVQVIMIGKKAMPAFGNTLSASEVENVAVYVKSLQVK